MPRPLQPHATRKRGRPRSPEIERRVLRVAQAFIAGCGLDGVAMNEIAWKAGTSKATIYLHFRSKQDLFEAALEDLLTQLPPATQLTPHGSSEPIADQLLAIAKQVNQLLSSASFQLFRRALASNIPTPLRERIWKRAGLPYLQAIEDYLLVQASRGLLELKDSRSAASWFLALVAGGEALRSQWSGSSFGLIEDDDLREAVRLFIRGHTPQPTLSPA